MATDGSGGRYGRSAVTSGCAAVGVVEACRGGRRGRGGRRACLGRDGLDLGLRGGRSVDRAVGRCLGRLAEWPVGRLGRELRAIRLDRIEPFDLVAVDDRDVHLGLAYLAVHGVFDADVGQRDHRPAAPDAGDRVRAGQAVEETAHPIGAHLDRDVLLRCAGSPFFDAAGFAGVDEPDLVARDDDLVDDHRGAAIESFDGDAQQLVLVVVVEHVAQPVAIEDGPPRQDAVDAESHEVDDPGGVLGREIVRSEGFLGRAEGETQATRDQIHHEPNGRRHSAAAKPSESPGCASIQTMTNDSAPHRPTLMTVHAHPDDETIGTGGAMAKAIEAGHRVILVTGTRGELGEIVVPDMDTPDNHRRLGEIRAGELERAMGHLGVHRVGEPGLPRLRDDGDRGEQRPAVVLEGRPGRGGWAARLVRADVPAGRHHHLQRVRRLRASRPHPDA